MAEYKNITELPHVEDISIENFIDGDVPSLVWGLNVPASVDAERLVINMAALQRYQRVGAIGSSVVLEYQGEQTEFTPGVSGINADGSAIATSAGTIKKADKSKSDVIDPIGIPQYAAQEFGKPVILHYLNKAEMAQNISDIVRNRGQSHEEAWASQIDVSLRDSFRKSGREHLVGRDGRWRYLDYAFYPYAATTILAEALNGKPPIIGAVWVTYQSIYTC